MKNLRLYAASALLLSLLSGCAGIRVVPITSDKQDKRDRGFRYYENSPYLLVNTDETGELTGKILFLPDLNTKTSISPYAIVAKNDTQLTFSKGVLTQAISDQDATQFPKEVIKALTSVVKASSALNAPGEAAVGGKLAAPYLFKIVVEDGTVKLIGGSTTPDRVKY